MLCQMNDEFCEKTDGIENSPGYFGQAQNEVMYIASREQVGTGN